MPSEQTQNSGTISQTAQGIIEGIQTSFAGASGWQVDPATELARTQLQYSLFADALREMGKSEEEIAQVIGNARQNHTRRDNQ